MHVWPLDGRQFCYSFPTQRKLQECFYSINKDEKNCRKHRGFSYRRYSIRTGASYYEIPIVHHVTAIFFHLKLELLKSTLLSRVGSLSHQAQGPIEFLIHIGNITEGVHISFMTNSKYLVLLTSAPFIANVYLYDVKAIKKKTTPFNVIFFEVS